MTRVVLRLLPEAPRSTILLIIIPGGYACTSTSGWVRRLLREVSRGRRPASGQAVYVAATPQETDLCTYVIDREARYGATHPH